MDQSQTLTGSAATAEIRKIQTDAAHPDYAKFKSSDPATLQKVSELWRATSTEDDDRDDDGAEPEQPPAEPEKKDELSQEEDGAVDEREAEAEKTRSLEQLKQDWGDAYEQKAEAAGSAVHALFNHSDSQDVEILEALGAKLGNHPKIINHLAELADKIPQGHRALDVGALSPAERDRLARQADAFLFQGIFKKAIPEGNESITNWLAKVGMRLFTPAQPVEQSDSKPAPVDARVVSAAQREIKEIQSGGHRLSERWKKGEAGARDYMNKLYQKLTGGK